MPRVRYHIHHDHDFAFQMFLEGSADHMVIVPPHVDLAIQCLPAVHLLTSRAGTMGLVFPNDAMTVHAAAISRADVVAVLHGEGRESLTISGPWWERGCPVPHPWVLRPDRLFWMTLRAGKGVPPGPVNVHLHATFRRDADMDEISLSKPA